MPPNPIPPPPDFERWAPDEIDHAVDERFAAIATRFADRAAIVDAAATWTYEALDRRAQSIAAAIVESSAAERPRVGILAPPGGPLAAAMLGTLMAGGAFVPFDPTHPVARLAAIATDAELDLLLVDDEMTDLARVAFTGPLPVLALSAADRAGPPGRIGLGRAGDPAYLLFTSGSTGEPKGVLHTNRDHLHDMRVYTNALRIAPSDRVLLAARPAFRAGLMDLFAGLLTGATVVTVDLAEAGFEGLRRAIQEHRVTVYHSTPTVLRELVAMLEPGEILAHLRIVVLGGEPLLTADLERSRSHLRADTIVVNTLGSTESLIALQFFATADTAIEAATVPSGYPVEETEVLLLDPSGVPADREGEIAVRSRYVARGYWRRPELNAESFVADPSGDGPALYRTGDLGHRRDDGAIDFLGRRDRQVKIHGVRIEVDEIEEVLARVPGTAQVAVELRRVGGEDRLVAYLESRGPERPSNAELRAALRARLPEPMLPGAFVWLDRMPWTSTNKIDRQALPDPDVLVAAPRPLDAVAGDDLEARLSAIWEAVFGRHPISRDDDFFDLGGHSLLAARLFDRIWKDTGQRIPLSALLEDSTISRLAARIHSGRDRAGDRVIALKPSGSKPPLFVVPGTGSHVLYLRNLAAHVDPEQPVYGLHAAPDRVGSAGDRAVPAIARRHVAALRRIQPHGPYHVVGFSFGGVVAYEVGQQLVALGEPVALLGLIDSRHPGQAMPAPGFHPRFVLRRIVNQARIVRRLGPRDGLRYLGTRVAIARDRTVLAARGALSAAVPRLRARFGPDPITDAERDWKAADAAAIERYRAEPFPGRITFLWPEHNQRPPEVFDTRRGWAALASDGLDVRPIPGSHLTVLVEPLARITTATLLQAVDEAAPAPAEGSDSVEFGAPAKPPNRVAAAG